MFDFTIKIWLIDSIIPRTVNIVATDEKSAMVALLKKYPGVITEAEAIESTPYVRN